MRGRYIGDVLHGSSVVGGVRALVMAVEFVYLFDCEAVMGFKIQGPWAVLRAIPEQNQNKRPMGGRDGESSYDNEQLLIIFYETVLYEQLEYFEKKILGWEHGCRVYYIDIELKTTCKRCIQVASCLVPVPVHLFIISDTAAHLLQY